MLGITFSLSLIPIAISPSIDVLDLRCYFGWGNALFLVCETALLSYRMKFNLYFG